MFWLNFLAALGFGIALTVSTALGGVMAIWSLEENSSYTELVLVALFFAYICYKSMVRLFDNLERIDK